MKTYEALHAAINGQTLVFARQMGLSTSLLNKWQEPHVDFTDSGAYNPLDRIEAIIETALAQGNREALAPLQYLAEKFGLIIIPVPKPQGCLADVTHELIKTVKEFGELASVAATALADARITRKEAEQIRKEAFELMRQVAAFDKKAQEAAI